jgi:hypothetical protein
MNKIFTVFTTLFFLSSQTFGSTHNLKTTINVADIVSSVSADMSSNEIYDTATETVMDAIKSGTTEKEFIESISDQMSLELTDGEIEETIEDMRADHSKGKLMALAQDLSEQSEDQRVIGVLITFVIMTALLLGLFFLLAYIIGEEPVPSKW